MIDQPANTSDFPASIGAMTGDRETFLREGMNDYLSKPVAMDNLREAIDRVMGPMRPN